MSDSDQESPAVSVVLVDDHEIVRRGIRMMIDAAPDLTVLGEASSVPEGQAVIEALKPDVAVIDLRLGDGTGTELIARVRASCPDTRCLILTSFSEPDAIEQAAVAGAVGYILKQVRGTDILAAIRSAAQGTARLEVPVSPAFDPHHELDRLVESLSRQERKILDQLAIGHSNREIAAELGLAEKTVKNYVSALLTKMGMSRRTEAAVYAARLEERHRRVAEWESTPPSPN